MKCKHCKKKITKKKYKKYDGFCEMCRMRYEDEQIAMYGHYEKMT